MKNDDRILLAEVGAPQGVRGQVRLKAHTADPEAILDYPLTDEKGRPQELEIVGMTGQGMLVVQFPGVRDRNAAEALKGMKLYTLAEHLPETEEDEFYIEELRGMRVVDAAGKPLGVVQAVLQYGAGDILDIAFDDPLRKGEMVSFTKANFPHIDVSARQITFTPPDEVEVKDE
ncbi:16S rRNA processing protein RimM [bacterium]|nr:16S rRNA processing protein RimM [bacterium]